MIGFLGKLFQSKSNWQEILELENQIEHKYPKLYKDFFEIQTFYELENVGEITL
jgi:hypothetical protein